jgi:hypothetical protein
MGKGYFAGYNNNEPVSNVVTGHSDADINAKYSSAPLGAVCVPGIGEVAC